MRAFSMTNPPRVGERRDAHAHRSARGLLDVPPAADEVGVEEVMRADPICLAESDGLDRIKSLLLERRVGGVPVVGSDGRPVGVVSGGDLLRALLHGGRPPPTTAGEIMTSMVFALPITASVAQAAALMAYEGVQLLVITERDGEVVGVVSSLDITRWCARTSGYLVEREEQVEAA